jgi:hypothetical protein
MGGDPTWDAIVAAADQLTRDAGGLTSKVEAARRRSWASRTLTEGLAIADHWTDAFEPVRRRGLFGGEWTTIQSVDEAAATVGRFLRERPDFR